MIIRVQFVKIKYYKPEVIYPWAIFAVRESDTISQVCTQIKNGKYCFCFIFTSVIKFYLLSTLLCGPFGKILTEVLMNSPSDSEVNLNIPRSIFSRMAQIIGYLVHYFTGLGFLPKTPCLHYKG